MPKGGRGQRDYEKEVEDAIKRMRKYKEHLRSARDSDSWVNFLDKIGVNPLSFESEKGSAFWEEVRSKIDLDYKADRLEKMRKFEEEMKEIRWLIAKQRVEARVEVKVYRDSAGRFTKVAEDNIPVASIRSKATGQYISRKQLVSEFP